MNPTPSSTPSETGQPTPARSPRPLAAPVLTFDFAAEARRLREEGPWLQHGRNGVTLVKYADFRIVFMLMKPGTRLQEHHARGRISVQTLTGRVRLHLEKETVELPAGSLLALERDLPHDVEAVEESTVLLTIAWPEGSDAP